MLLALFLDLFIKTLAIVCGLGAGLFVILFLVFLFLAIIYPFAKIFNNN